MTFRRFNGSKMGNVWTEVDGIKFQSKKEAQRYLDLKLLLKAKEISDLTLQEKFPFIINDIKVGSYVADFSYLNKAGEKVVEDVKSPYTRTLQYYRLKKKLLFACYGIDIKEV